jgi:hypothetical protein
VAILYRTAGAWGAGNGANLTPAQVDNNFWEVVGRLVDLETGAVASVNNILNISLVGTQLTVTMDDFSQFGPFTVPIAAFHWRGAWAVDTDYSELDLFYSTGSGVFMVLLDHTSDAYTFDAAYLVDGQPAYQQLFPDMISFLNLTDAPDTYYDYAGYYVTVNDAEDALTFTRPEYHIKFFFKGIPAADDLMWAEKVPWGCEIDATEFTAGGFYFTPPTASQVNVWINVNGAPEASFAFHDDGTYSVPAITLVLTAGDELTLTFQETVDATFGDLGIQIIGHRNPF